MTKIKAVLAIAWVVAIVFIASVVTILSVQDESEQCYKIGSTQCSVFKQ